jgi:CRISPR locus-related DNA-binding protein
MERYISAIGFSPNLVTRPIIANGISTGDTVQIIRPEQTSENAETRVSNAIENVQSTLSGAVNSVEIEVLTITDLAFDAVVDRCSEIIANGDPPVVCLGAGATDVQIPLTVAATAHQHQIKSTMMYSDLEATANRIDIPPLTNRLPGRARDTFRLVAEIDDGSGVSLPELSEQQGTARSTVGRHIQSLEKNGFVRTTREQKSKVAFLTPLGRITYRGMDEQSV